MARVLILASTLIGLGACAVGTPSPEALAASMRSVTADAIGIQDTSAISIENPKRLPTKWEWKAVHAGVAFACNADDSLRLPDCSPLSENHGG